MAGSSFSFFRLFRLFFSCSNPTRNTKKQQSFFSLLKQQKITKKAPTLSDDREAFGAGNGGVLIYLTFFQQADNLTA